MAYHRPTADARQTSNESPVLLDIFQENWHPSWKDAPLTASTTSVDTAHRVLPRCGLPGTARSRFIDGASPRQWLTRGRSCRAHCSPRPGTSQGLGSKRRGACRGRGGDIKRLGCGWALWRYLVDRSLWHWEGQCGSVFLFLLLACVRTTVGTNKKQEPHIYIHIYTHHFSRIPHPSIPHPTLLPPNPMCWGVAGNGGWGMRGRNGWRHGGNVS
jgi:hypothetical protein